MTKQIQLKVIKQGDSAWNSWRIDNPNVIVNLSGVDLSGVNLSGVDLSDAKLFRANLAGANLYKANLYAANLFRANLASTNLREAFLDGADLSKTNLTGADLTGADLTRADLTGANLSGADLYGAELSSANLSSADLSDADLSRTDLSGAQLVSTNICYANLRGSRIYGISAWDLKTTGSQQESLIITKLLEADITVDNLEVAQFIYLMLNNEKIRDVIGTIAKKGVLILGRFTPERKKILDAIRVELRAHDYVPMMFDFEKVKSRDFTETIKVLAGMSRFIIADITNPKSSPLELQATIPNYKIPFIPIIQKGESPFAMFADLKMYDWVLELMEYGSETQLMEGFEKGILNRAMAADKRIMDQKANLDNPPLDISDYK